MLIMIINSCKKEFENHNAASEEAVYKTAEAYPGIILGMTKDFTQKALPEIIRGPGVVSREIAATSTFLTEKELESGDIPNENSSLSNLWSYLHYERGIASRVSTRIDDVVFINDTEKKAIKAYAKFFEGMTTAYLGFYWEKATLENDLNNKAEFKSRTDVLNEALNKFDEALSLFTSQPGADAYINGLVSNQFDIISVINIFKGRIYLELEDWQNAIQAADNVDISSKSLWTYDNSTSNRNPIFVVQYAPGNHNRWKAIENMGVTPEAGDARLTFYLGASTGITSEICGYNTNYILGFWDNEDEDIPVFLPDETYLIKAEAYAQMGGGHLADAVLNINKVRTDNADLFGVNAGLGNWTGDATNQQAVLDQVFYNYAMELYLQGTRWLAHRRIYSSYLNGVTPPVNCSLKRTRNYYPYPYTEKSNNPNTPSDPSI